MATGLVVHPGQPSRPNAQDEASIRQAFADAYSGGSPDATVLAAVENGQALAPVLAEFKQKEPQTARTVRVVVHRVEFNDASHANVTYSLTFERPGSQSSVAVRARSKSTVDGRSRSTGSACSSRSPESRARHISWK
jgi:cysteine sulfinate desulfinase/cysteine desulfurase-like protein